jgi:hypothetical protein
MVINRLLVLFFRVSGRVSVSSIYNISGGFGLSFLRWPLRWCLVAGQ